MSDKVWGAILTPAVIAEEAHLDLALASSPSGLFFVLRLDLLKGGTQIAKVHA
jgi:hypothetical protein